MPCPINCSRQYPILSRTRIKHSRRMDYRIDLPNSLIIGKHCLMKHIARDEVNPWYIRELRANTKEGIWVAREYNPFRVGTLLMSQPVVKHRSTNKTSSPRYQYSLQFNSSIVSDLRANNFTADVREATVAAISSV